MQLVDKFKQALPTETVSRPSRYDISRSADGVLVASTAFRAAALELLGDRSIEFTALRLGMHAMMPRKIVRFDAGKRRTQFEYRCQACGQYESVIGATPVFLMDPSSLTPLDVARTDLEFGSDDEKRPMILFGDEAARKLLERPLKGLELLVNNTGDTGAA